MSACCNHANPWKRWNMKDFQWHEPASYRRAISYENERRNPQASAKFAGVAFAIVLGLRFIFGRQTDSHPPAWSASVAIAALIALFAAYGLPAVVSLLPASIVIFSEKGVNNNVMTGRGWNIRFWPWEQIAYCTVGVDSAGGRTYEVIYMHAVDNRLLATLAFTDRSVPVQINDFLHAHGKPPLLSAAH
jgi:hypothetical protein